MVNSNQILISDHREVCTERVHPKACWFYWIAQCDVAGDALCKAMSGENTESKCETMFRVCSLSYGLEKEGGFSASLSTYARLGSPLAYCFLVFSACIGERSMISAGAIAVGDIVWRNAQGFDVKGKSLTLRALLSGNAHIHRQTYLFYRSFKVTADCPAVDRSTSPVSTPERSSHPAVLTSTLCQGCTNHKA